MPAGRRLAAGAAVAAVLVTVLVLLPASGPADARSSGFSSPNLAPGDDLAFSGSGWGHGVGISHQSLPARAAAGQSATDILHAYYPGTTLTGGWQLDDLRVFLAATRNSRFRVRGAFEIVVDGSTVHSSSTSRLFGVVRNGNSWTVTASGGAALCSGQVCSGNVLEIRAADGVAVESSATGHSYSHGRMTLTKLSGNSWYRVVLADLKIEEYLRGVAEIPPDWPAEALRAQAIASRTYALHIARENRGSDTWNAPFDLYATTANQVYDGNTREFSPHNGPWLQAVADTAGQVLTYSGTPALTLFTTSGGGYTENSGYAFNEQLPYLVAVQDPFTVGDPYTPWTRSYSVSALSRWLARTPDTNVGTLRHIDVSGNISVSGRIDRATVRLTGTLGTKSVSGQRFVFVVNKGAESEGWGPLPNTAGRGGHLLSTRFVFGEAGALPADLSTTIGVPTLPAADPPTAPRSVGATSRPNEIHVTWQPPADDGGSPVTGYTIHWASSTGASGTIPTTETSRTLRNLSNSATYTISVTANNAGGISPQITVTASPLGTPGAPTDVRLQRGDGLLEVTWSPPASDGGLGVESYTVHWTAPGGVVNSAPAQTTRYVIGGLTNGATYSVTVTATNRAGTSPQSEPADSRPGTAPSAPREVTTSRGDSRVDVSWQPPSNDGGLGITRYEIAWISSTGATGIIETAETGYTMRNLLNGATYTVTVTAVNEAGRSSASNQAAATAAATPGAPRAVTVDRGDSRIDVTWQPPASDGGRPVLSYIVTWTASDGTTGSIETVRTSHTFDALTNGTTYTVTVAAINEEGASPGSEPASGTPAHVPGAPVAVRTTRDDSRLHVTWDPPGSDGGVRVTGYTVLWVAPDGTTLSAETGDTGYTIDGLINGTTYGITVMATNEVGTSVTASPVRATPARAPGPLASAEIALEHEALRVTWQPPTDDGGLPVRSYTVTWVAPDGTVASADTTQTSHLIENLIGGAAYTVTILANNEVGASATPMSAEATPQHAAPTAAGGSSDAAQTATARPSTGEGTPAVSAEAQTAPAAPASPSTPAPNRIRTWQDSIANDTVVIVLAAVGLVLIATLLVITRRRRHLEEEAVADIADIW